MTKIIVVDEHDKEIGAKERDGLDPWAIYRVSALWLTNSKGEVLLAQRSFKKQNSPGLWGPAVAGTVEENETYESNILKEMKEEIGLENIEVKPFRKIRVHNERLKNYFCQYFSAILDLPTEEFNIDKAEVEQVKWFDKEYLRKDFEQHPEKYVNSIKHFL